MSLREAMTQAKEARAGALGEAAERIAEASVHPLETVAFLECEGFSDNDARLLGKPNLFVLAGGLRNAGAPEKEIETVVTGGTDRSPDLQSLEIPIVTTPVSVAPIRAERTPYRHLVRGVIYFLPAMALATLLPGALTRAELMVLPLALIFSWATAQAIAYVAYQQTGFGPGAEARFLRRAITVGAAIAASAGLALYLTSVVSYGTALAVTAQGCLMIATAVMVISNCELYLAVLLLPGAIAGGVRLASGERSLVGMVVAFGCLSLATVAAWIIATRRIPANRPEFVIRPSRSHTAAHALSGGLLAVLAVWIPTAVGFNPTVAVSAAALVLVSGGAEYFLVALRHEGRADLTRHTELHRFRRSVGGRLRAAILVYAAVIVSGQFLAWVFFPPDWRAGAIHMVLVSASMVVLGTIFFVQGVAISLYGVMRVIPLSLVAVLVLVAAALLSGRSGVGTFLLVTIPLLVASFLVTFFQSCIPSRHR